MEKAFAIPISRRDFMKLAGLTAAGTLLGVQDNVPKAEASAAPAHRVDFEKAAIPTLFNVDVCVVGGGSAGTAAAVTAARKGAKVVLVERGISLLLSRILTQAAGGAKGSASLPRFRA